MTDCADYMLLQEYNAHFNWLHESKKQHSLVFANGQANLVRNLCHHWTTDMSAAQAATEATQNLHS